MAQELLIGLHVFGQHFQQIVTAAGHRMAFEYLLTAADQGKKPYHRIRVMVIQIFRPVLSASIMAV